MHPLHVRPGTGDRGICHLVVHRNEYRLPARLGESDLVVDIGAHVGSFAYAALLRGSRRVWAVEADAENVRMAHQNLAPFLTRGEATLLHGAVWRSDANDDVLRFSGYPGYEGLPRLQGIVNTGGGSVIWAGEGTVVPKLAFDDLMARVTGEGKERVRLVKLDCEGSEWPILLTSRTLGWIDEICGEFHEIGSPYPGIDHDQTPQESLFSLPEAPPLTAETLVRCLGAAGFEVTYERHRRPNGEVEGQGLFFARRVRS
ncbi:MAG TPA: FkbM family methyltransferase [Thermoanaerobaculia bacterium]|jgi:FkbM family methyltransferase|nr:FkbM family methyltransferase [Thermoanaerobaculia bacterium]